VVLQALDVGAGGVAAIDEREGVARGEAGCAVCIALAEAGALQQPRGGELDAVIGGGPLRNLRGATPAAAAMLASSSAVTMGFLKKEPALRQSGSPGTRSIPLLRRRSRTAVATSASVGSGMVGEGALQLAVAQARKAVRMQAEAHVRDDVAVGFILVQRAVEEALAVAKAALGARDIDEFAGLTVQGADGFDGLRDLLTVGADVLDWAFRPPSRGCRRGTRCRPCESESAWSTKASQGSPAATSKMPLAVCCRMPRSAMCRTRPAKPPSRTSRLLPPPRTKSGRLRSRAHATAATMSSSVVAVAKIPRWSADAEGGERGERNGFADGEVRRTVHDFKRVSAGPDRYLSRPAETAGA
jgi:hypothetical protein